ncbi:M50 family metallopeptidase [Legionella fairfieldensis]|uniref:M50 family metallopeptidase n=1 Tax=Legionella fairfieldensis TaxID=45064 RepID=UPI0004900284|nr:site-2 protease family protein [Legionella fairfieldensis]
MIAALFAIVLTLLLVVGLHEAGHAITARFFLVKIQRIAIGFGKPLLTWKDKAGREWVWAIWPLGGYVHMLNSRIQPVAEKDLALCFDKKPVWIRCIILLAGGVANLLTAWLALTLLFMLGYKQQLPFIQNVVPQSIAAKAGLQGGDRFVAIEGQTTNSWQEVGMGFIMAFGKEKVPALVSGSDGRLRSVSLNLDYWHYTKKEDSILKSLGIIPAPAKFHTEQVAGQSPGQAVWLALTKSWRLIVFFLVMFKQLVTGVIPFAVLLGPLGLLAVSINSFLQGLAVFLYFIASLSLAVGLINLFPIPGLDGGSIVYALIEKWRGRPFSVALEVLLYRLTVIGFSVLFIQLLLNDVQRYMS